MRCGSGLRGYGKLVIIKHDATYLSVYAHNRELRVKEGERVARGQTIAEMGSFDAERAGVHFEIRRLGKPVDPRFIEVKITKPGYRVAKAPKVPDKQGAVLLDGWVLEPVPGAKK